MTKYQLETLLDALDFSRERLLVAIEPLPDQALLMKNVVGAWSVADILANLTAWEAELVTGMMRLDQGKQPDKLLEALKNPAAYDEERYAENRGRDLDQVFEDFQLVRVKLEEWLEMFSERALNNPKQYRWFAGKSLGKIVAETTYEREGRFIPNLESFAKRWEDGSLFAPTRESIRLDDVSVENIDE